MFCKHASKSYYVKHILRQTVLDWLIWWIFRIDVQSKINIKRGKIVECQLLILFELVFFG